MGVNADLISFLKKAMDKIETSGQYQWGHSGACNCGHLAQVMTGHSKAELLHFSQEREGDWTEQSKLYCEASGEKIDNVISKMLSLGLNLEDIQDIEYLSNPQVLGFLDGGKRFLERNKKENVLLYFQAWVSLLEDMNARNEMWSAVSMSDKDLDRAEIFDSVPEEAYK